MKVNPDDQDADEIHENQNPAHDQNDASNNNNNNNNEQNNPDSTTTSKKKKKKKNKKKKKSGATGNAENGTTETAGIDKNLDNLCDNLVNNTIHQNSKARVHKSTSTSHPSHHYHRAINYMTDDNEYLQNRKNIYDEMNKMDYDHSFGHRYQNINSSSDSESGGINNNHLYGLNSSIHKSHGRSNLLTDDLDSNLLNSGNNRNIYNTSSATMQSQFGPNSQSNGRIIRHGQSTSHHGSHSGQNSYREGYHHALDDEEREIEEEEEREIERQRQQKQQQISNSNLDPEIVKKEKKFAAIRSNTMKEFNKFYELDKRKTVLYRDDITFGDKLKVILPDNQHPIVNNKDLQLCIKIELEDINLLKKSANCTKNFVYNDLPESRLDSNHPENSNSNSKNQKHQNSKDSEKTSNNFSQDQTHLDSNSYKNYNSNLKINFSLQTLICFMLFRLKKPQCYINKNPSSTSSNESVLGSKYKSSNKNNSLGLEKCKKFKKSKKID